MKLRYLGKNVLITGGSEGMGKSIAVLFASLGANVFIFSRSQVKIKKALEEIKANVASAAQKCDGFSLDVTDFQKVKTRYNAVVKKYGLPDILINAAGYSYPDYFENIPIEHFHSMMDVNYFGIVHSIKALFPHFQKKGSGEIVNVSSLSAFLPVFGYTGYTATKFAVLGFSEVLKSEMRRHNIRVSVLCPPDTKTPGFEEENKTKPEETIEISKSAKPFTAEKIAEVFEKGFRRKKFLIIPGFDGKLAFRVRRFFPGLLNMIFDSSIKKAQKKKGK